jgi:hypothetical protein
LTQPDLVGSITQDQLLTFFSSQMAISVSPWSRGRHGLAVSELPPEALNDDYCDCRDGAEEPRTAACGQGRFRCENAGRIPRSIASSMVKDGVQERMADFFA